MDRSAVRILGVTGLRPAIAKAEHGPGVIEAIRRHGAAYLIALGGAGHLVSKTVREAEAVTLHDIGMEAYLPASRQ